MRRLIKCACELQAGNHKKCEWCGAHMPTTHTHCDASDCERVGGEFRRSHKPVLHAPVKQIVNYVLIDNEGKFINFDYQSGGYPCKMDNIGDARLFTSTPESNYSNWSETYGGPFRVVKVTMQLELVK